MNLNGGNIRIGEMGEKKRKRKRYIKVITTYKDSGRK